MFFVAKATLCIGLVAVVASQSGGESLATRLDGDARAVTASVGRACWSSAGCMRIGTGMMAAAVDGATARSEVQAPRRTMAQGTPDGQRRRDAVVRAPFGRQPELRG